MANPVYLRTLRERRGYTQVQLAERSGVKQDHISKLETKPPKRGPHADVVIALAQALGVAPARLRFGPDLSPVTVPVARGSRQPDRRPGASA